MRTKDDISHWRTALCRAVSAAVILAVYASALFSFTFSYCQTLPKRSGKYNITISFGGDYTNNKKVKYAFLIKERWGNPKGITIDSLPINKDKVCFKGDVYPLEAVAGKEDMALFTAGEYKIRVGSTILFRFFYSSSDGGNFTEQFEKIPSESVYIQEYRRIAKKRDKYGPENELYLNLQNYQKLLALLKVRDVRVGEAAEKHISSIADSLRTLGNYLKMRAERECENSLFNTLISFTSLPSYTPEPQHKMTLIGDDRLVFTRFGEEIFKSLMNSVSSQPRAMATEDVYKILDNRYLTSPALKSAMVKTAFESFKDSPVMGSEGTAIDIAQKYILSKAVTVDESLFFDANYFNTLNSKSLLGMKGPDFNLKDTSGRVRTLQECLGLNTIIYFYTDDCSRCAIETPKLVTLLDNYSYGPLGLVTVYIGNDESKWKEYLSKFHTINPFVERIDVADIDKESSALLDYGIVSTPTFFLLDKNGKITGRKIKSSTIREILENQENSRRQIVSYFSQIFTGGDADETKRIIDTLAGASTGDFYTELMSELYSFLSNSDNYANQLGAEYLGDKYICSQRDKWENKKYADGVCHAVKMFNLNKLGEKATDLLLYDEAGMPHNLLSASPRKKVLFFYRPDCGICTESLEGLKKLYKKYRKELIFCAVYVGENESEFKKYVVKNRLEWTNLWDKDSLAQMREKYDVEETPKIYLLDENNIVIAKDIDVYDLEKLLAGNSE